LPFKSRSRYLFSQGTRIIPVENAEEISLGEPGRSAGLIGRVAHDGEREKGVLGLGRKLGDRLGLDGPQNEAGGHRVSVVLDHARALLDRPPVRVQEALERPQTRQADLGRVVGQGGQCRV